MSKTKVNFIFYYYRDLADTQYTGPLLFLPWLVQIAPKITRWNAFVNSVTTVHQFLSCIIKAHKETFAKEKMRDFIDYYLAEIAKTSNKQSSFYGSTGGRTLLRMPCNKNVKLFLRQISIFIDFHFVSYFRALSSGNPT